MSVYQTITVVVALLFLLVGPVCFFMLKHRLVKHFTFCNVRKFTNHTGLVYMVVWGVLWLCVSILTQSLIVSQDFLGPDGKTVLFSIFIFFGTATVFYYLPLVIIVNATFFLWRRFLAQPGSGL